MRGELEVPAPRNTADVRALEPFRRAGNGERERDNAYKPVSGQQTGHASVQGRL